MRTEITFHGVIASVGGNGILRQVKMLKPTLSLLCASLPTTQELFSAAPSLGEEPQCKQTVSHSSSPFHLTDL